MSKRYHLLGPATRRRLGFASLIVAASFSIAGSRASAEDPALVYSDSEARRSTTRCSSSTAISTSRFTTAPAGTIRDGMAHTQVDLPKLERGGVDSAVFAVFAKQGWRTPEGLSKAPPRPIENSKRSWKSPVATPNAALRLRPTTSNEFTGKGNSPSSSAS